MTTPDHCTKRLIGRAVAHAGISSVNGEEAIRGKCFLTEIIGCLEAYWDERGGWRKVKWPKVYATTRLRWQSGKEREYTGMRSKHDDAKGYLKVFEVRLPEYPVDLQVHLFRTLFKDRCGKCSLPSYVEIGSPPEVDLPTLKHDFGRACGFWLARKDFAERLCAEFESQFDMRKIADDAYFLILKNVLVPDDPIYEDAGDCDLMFFKNKERICSLCGKPYILLNKGFLNFKGGNRIKPRTIYETSLKFGTADVKYPRNFCDEEAAYALREISRKFKFVRSMVKFSVDAV